MKHYMCTQLSFFIFHLFPSYSFYYFFLSSCVSLFSVSTFSLDPMSFLWTIDHRDEKQTKEFASMSQYLFVLQGQTCELIVMLRGNGCVYGAPQNIYISIFVYMWLCIYNVYVSLYTDRYTRANETRRQSSYTVL